MKNLKRAISIIVAIAVVSVGMNVRVAEAEAPTVDNDTFGYPTVASADFSCGTSDGENCKHTATGTNTLVVVGIEKFDTVNDITSVTYDGVAMKEATARTIASHTIHCYYLVAPNSTANAVTRIQASSANDYRVEVMSFSGVFQTNPLIDYGNAAANPGTSLSITLNVTGTSTNDVIIVAHATSEDNGGVTSGADTSVIASHSGYATGLYETSTDGGTEAVDMSANSGKIGMCAMSFEGIASAATYSNILYGHTPTDTTKVYGYTITNTAKIYGL